MNVFEEFHGADLYRFAECILAIRAAGLETSRFTQAGVNHGSGNVWVWDESWAGCVACSVGFDVFWSYSCPECGEEHEFKTYANLSAYAERYDYQTCEECQDTED